MKEGEWESEDLGASPGKYVGFAFSLLLVGASFLLQTAHPLASVTSANMDARKEVRTSLLSGAHHYDGKESV